MLDFIYKKTPLVFFAQSFWRDEAFSYLLAKKSLLTLLISTAKDFNPPLYYLILKMWMNLFGSSEISLRSLSFIFYWGTIYVIYLITADFFKKNLVKMLPYLLIFVLNPILTYYAFEARMYSMFAFFATCSFYFFYKKNRSAYWFVSILGLYTHYFMIFVLVTQIFYLILIRSKFSAFKKILFPFVFFFPWVIFVLINKHFSNTSFWITRISVTTIFELPAILYTGYEKDIMSQDNRIVFLSAIFIFLVFIGYLKFRKPNQLNGEKKHFFQFIFSWSFFTPVLVILISFFKPVFLPRYFIFSSVGFLILITVILEMTKRPFRTIFYIFLLIITLISLNMSIKYRRKMPLNKTIFEIKKMAKKNDRLYVIDDLDYFTAQYYWGEKNVYIYRQNYSNIPNYVGKVLIDKNAVIDSLPLFPIKAFILKRDGSYSIQALY